eukprot:6177411-Pleurochrysis_carterae.AAC.3
MPDARSSDSITGECCRYTVYTHSPSIALLESMKACAIIAASKLTVPSFGMYGMHEKPQA